MTWRLLAERFALDSSATTQAEVVANRSTPTDDVVLHLQAKGLALKQERDGRVHLTCPWSDQHTTESDASATTYWPAHTGGYARGHFACLHAHCSHRTDDEFLQAIGAPSLVDQFEPLNPDTAQDPAQSAQGAAETKTPPISLRFQPIPASKFAAAPSLRWLIKGVLPEAELVVLYGESGSGKTFATLDMAMALSRGVTWRGRRTRQGRAVYVAAEGARGVRGRIKAYAEHHALDLALIPLDVIDATPNLLERADALDLVKAIQAGGPVSTVWIDTMAQAMAGGDENTGKDVGRLLTHCKGIHRATGATVILIHHTGKDATKGARGWSGLKAAADAMLEVVRSEESRALCLDKQKDGGDREEFAFKLTVVQIGQDEDGEPITSCVVAHGEGSRPRRISEPKGALQKLALRTVADLAELGPGGAPVMTVVERMSEQLPAPDAGGRDYRRRHAMRAVEALIADGALTCTDNLLTVR